ncbi:MAG: hypothetical protein KGM46_08805 [Pseudomonadota bacterium]|nr:hypothetical protein [Xanthomonadaceae bacterium]MDE3210827.1 hypothetical protein [Pseudomonadota bacterium]
MLAQYVYPSRFGLMRIVKHGRRWRALLEEREIARHESAETALSAMRAAFARARIPASLALWRQIPASTRLAHRGLS